MDYVERQDWHRKRVRKMAQRLFGKLVCAECGSPNNISYHHVKMPAIFSISQGLYLSNGEIWKEMKKCIPLCFRCHTRVENRLRRERKEEETIRQEIENERLLLEDEKKYVGEQINGSR